MATTLLEYEKALASLKEAIDFHAKCQEEVAKKIARDALIQRFEFCVELSWKVAAKTMGSRSTTANPVIREMAQNLLIADPGLWFEFVEARNKTSHSYNEAVAQEVHSTAIRFMPEGMALLEKLKQG